MTIARIWKSAVLPGRVEDYERFTRDVSLPMFSKQQGFQGVLMLRSDDECFVITLWSDMHDVDALWRSESYQAVLQRLLNSGFVAGEASVKLYTAHLTGFAANGIV